MSDDLIKRSDAIAEICKVRTPDVASHQYAELFINAVRRAPSADRPQGEWIPCSERLPSEKGMYLVTSREKATAEEFGFDLDDVEVKKMRFDEDGWRIPKHIPEWINGVVHTTVLAWMPLPKPWEGADDE